MTKRIIVFLTVALLACDKNQERPPNVPIVQVNELININDPKYPNLLIIGGWEYINAGSRGLIVYRISQDIFAAYDRHCTYDPQEVCSTVDVDLSNIKVNDSDCCGSEFGLLDGRPINGPAINPLVSYATSFDGVFLTITN